MLSEAAARLLQSLLVLLTMSAVVFAGVYLIGNPLDMLIPPQASELERAQAGHALGLDQSLITQYLLFLQHALEGNLGRSFFSNSPALGLILDRLPATIELALSAALIAVGLGVPIGIGCAWYAQRFGTRVLLGLATLGFSVPTFWVGLLLIMLFSVQLQWLPSGGRDASGHLFGIATSFGSWRGLSHLLLPAISLALFKLALLIRLTYAATREVLQQDFILAARARGVALPRLLGVHVLRNIGVSLTQVIGLEFGALVAFSIVTESVFAWPGMGKLLIDAINSLDRPVVVAYLLVTVTLFTAINLVVDLIALVLDPRLRRAGLQ